MLQQTRDKRARGPLDWGKAAWQFEGTLRMKRVSQNTSPRARERAKTESQEQTASPQWESPEGRTSGER